MGESSQNSQLTSNSGSKKRTKSKTVGKSQTNILLPAVVGILSVVVIFISIVLMPCPTKSQYIVFRIILSLGAAGIAAIIPGFFKIHNKFVTAGGALGVFVLVYLYNPALIDTNDKCSDAFELTVFVHGKEGKGHLLLKNRGNVTLRLENSTIKKPINDLGEALFTDIPAKFRDIPIVINILEEEGLYIKAINADSLYNLGSNNSIDLIVETIGLDKIFGQVVDIENPSKPIENAIVSINEIMDTTNSNGYFSLSIPAELQKEKQIISVIHNTFQGSEKEWFVGSNEKIRIGLKRK